MPMRAPRICGCGYRIAAEADCPCERRRAAERNARAERNRPTARQRGYDTRWDKARAGYLKSHPRCAKCGSGATVVDHIEPHRGDQSLFWEKENWQALCTSCHSSAKQSAEKRGGNLLAHPFLRRSRVPVTLVCGPPGSGKSTYVRRYKQEGDLVIDLDLIKARIFGTTSHQAPQNSEATRVALVERNRILSSLADDRTHRHVWFIIGAPETVEREVWKRKLGAARLVVMDTPLHECIRRIRADPEREGQWEWMERAARKWFERAGLTDECIRGAI